MELGCEVSADCCVISESFPIIVLLVGRSNICSQRESNFGGNYSVIRASGGKGGIAFSVHNTVFPFGVD